MADFLFRGSLADLDPEVHKLTELETERQIRKLILIPSESSAPAAVRQSLASPFQNLYAEGYPDEETRQMDEAEILNLTARLANYRRYSDPRYYKGVEYADIIEALARRRCAEAFATPSFPANQLFVNVQPLSGAPANNAVYNALLNPGDAIMGMSLLHGGHLTHGSPVNRSGKLYHVVPFLVDPVTEQIDYDAVDRIAKENKPKIIISGFTSYPWVPDWARFRTIADNCGAILMADISHIAGLVAAGVVPSPVGIAQVITFTTHKTLCGPRGACILTHDASLARKLDRAVFPGEQGGPHVHVFAALATNFKLAKTEKFHQLQSEIIKNSVRLTGRLQDRGFRIPYGGTNTHLATLDCKTIIGSDGTTLSGDMAARILDIAGIVLNRNTIPGDKSALTASGIRFGTPWMTQRGLGEAEMVKVADIMADVLLACKPYSTTSRQGLVQRAKLDFTVLEDAKLRSRELAENAGDDVEDIHHGYPHFSYIDDIPVGGDWVAFDLRGDNIREFINYALTSDSEDLQPGQSQKTNIGEINGGIECTLTCVDEKSYRMSIPATNASLAAAWLRDLSDGYTIFDTDIARRMPGPVYVTESTTKGIKPAPGETVYEAKPFYIGLSGSGGKSFPEFIWEEKDSEMIRRTPLNETHRKLGARMVPFAGWEMPVVYTSIAEEHLATRQAAGIFDVSHMGIYQVEGPDACVFLDSVCANDVATLKVGQSCYTHFLNPNAQVIDDLLVYYRAKQEYLVVVNASNDDKDWTWLNLVRNGEVLIDKARPWTRAFGRNVILRNLRDPQAGGKERRDIALQGPRSRDILLALGCDNQTRRRILSLKRTENCEAVVGNFDLVVSRTGYTGEKMAFELFVHPGQVVDLWENLLHTGAPFGLKPCGLGARDSLRTEAGLPLYGHEMAGPLGLGVGAAGFKSYVKTYKPWFIGREAYIIQEKSRTGEVIRFRFTEKGVRLAHNGDPVIDIKGKMIGEVTSCSIDKEGFLSGLAYLDLKFTAENTPIAIFQSAAKTAGIAPAELKVGDRVVLPTAAKVVSRFPKLTA